MCECLCRGGSVVMVPLDCESRLAPIICGWLVGGPVVIAR